VRCNNVLQTFLLVALRASPQTLCQGFGPGLEQFTCENLYFHCHYTSLPCIGCYALDIKLSYARIDVYACGSKSVHVYVLCVLFCVFSSCTVASCLIHCVLACIHEQSACNCFQYHIFWLMLCMLLCVNIKVAFVHVVDSWSCQMLIFLLVLLIIYCWHCFVALLHV